MAKKNKKNSIVPILIGGGLLLLMSKGKGEPVPVGSGGESGASGSITEAQLQSAFNALKSKYGSAFAKEIEQLYRKETAHFGSGQFRKTYSPGMEVSPGNHSFPYGWSSLADFASAYKPTNHPPVNANTTYLVPMKENNTGITKYYVGFPDLFSAVQFVGYTLNKRVHPGYWRSTQPSIADAYRASYKLINTHYT